MLSVNYIGHVRYNTVKLATLDTIMRIVSLHTKFPHLMPAQGYNVTECVCRWRRCKLLTMFTDKEKS